MPKIFPISKRLFDDIVVDWIYNEFVINEFL